MEAGQVRELGDLTLEQLKLAIVNLDEPADFGSIDSYNTKQKALTWLGARIGEKRYGVTDVISAGTADPNKAFTKGRPSTNGDDLAKEAAGKKERKSKADKPKADKPKADKPKADKPKREASSGDNRKITVVSKENPKREGTTAHKHFALYKTGMTVTEYIKTGGSKADVNWDSSKGFIKLSGGN